MNLASNFLHNASRASIKRWRMKQSRTIWFGDDELAPRDSASQITSHRRVTSATSSVLKRIELERKKAELRNLEELSKFKLRKAKTSNKKSSKLKLNINRLKLKLRRQKPGKATLRKR